MASRRASSLSPSSYRSSSVVPLSSPWLTAWVFWWVDFACFISHVQLSHSDYFLLLSQSSFLFFIHTKDKAHSVVVFITFKVPLLLVMDEKRKASKKDMSSFSSPGSLFSRSTSTSNSPLLRSLSQKSSSSSSKCNNNNLPRSFLERNPSIGSKCTKLAKEQKARFYIMRRCVAMLGLKTNSLVGIHYFLVGKFGVQRESQSKYGIEDKTELLQLVRKYPEGLVVIDLKDAYPTVMEDLQTFAACSGAFEDPDIIHVDDIIDLVRDLEVITEELRLKDIQFMERKIQDIEKSMKRSNDKQLKIELQCCQRV
ncbi:Obg-like ATPase 1 [Glycine soja]